MIDTRLHTLLTLMEAGSYTKAARVLSLTQPAVSHHIRQLEQEYGAPVFYRSTKQLKLTPEGGILVKYARRMQALENNVIQSLEDYRNGLSRFTVGITPTAEENLVPRVMATYCNLHPDTSITIVTDTIKNIYNMLKSYEVDIGIVEGSIPDENLNAGIARHGLPLPDRLPAASLCPAGEREPGGAQRSKADFALTAGGHA